MYKFKNKNELTGLPEAAVKAALTCNGCRICSRQCDFLTQTRNPGGIARSYSADPVSAQLTAFKCSLCGLCQAVCPFGVDPPSMFLEFRKQAVKNGLAPLPAHNRLLKYEARGMSGTYSLYHLPTNCLTVFFPGCTLAGTRPETTFLTYQYLSRQYPGLGMVLDCCAKPSHDLGRSDFFDRMFARLKSSLRRHRITTILTACPSCHTTFSKYADEFTVRTVYDVMAEKGLPDIQTVSGAVAVHDPCQARFDSDTHQAVRDVIGRSGLEIVPSAHQEETTLCCGEGGAVGCMAPDLPASWTAKRISESSDHTLAAYCAGCVNRLSKKTEAVHVLDLVFNTRAALAGQAKPARAPMTYFNRIMLKKRIKKTPAQFSGER